MRIQILTQCYLPMTISGAKLIYDLATEMSRLGHEVFVVTPDDSLKRGIEISREDEVIVVRVKTRNIRHSNRIVRAIREIGLSRTIWNSARHFFETHPCDLVVYYSPTIFWSSLVNKLKALNRCGSYQILRDLFPQWAVDTGVIKPYGPIYWYFKRQETRLYGLSDVIGVQSPANLEYFSISPKRRRFKVEVLFNWASNVPRPKARGGWRGKLGLQDKVVFVYGGMLGVAQDAANLVRLAANLRDEKHVFFLLVGEGSEAGKVAREIDQRGLANIMVHPSVSQDDYLDILDECDVGLITLSRDLNTHNFPGKMLSYMQIGKPMLASINPGNDLGAILEGHEAGFVCNNGEDDLFSEYALRLANDPELRQRMGQNSLRLLGEKFNVSAAARQIISHFPQTIEA
jgi:glycosyltransferase involved in cell wall biosynthesis